MTPCPCTTMTCRSRRAGDAGETPCHLHNDDIDHFNEGIFGRRRGRGDRNEGAVHFMTGIQVGVVTVGRWRKLLAAVSWTVSLADARRPCTLGGGSQWIG